MYAQARDMEAESNHKPFNCISLSQYQSSRQREIKLKIKKNAMDYSKLLYNNFAEGQIHSRH